MIKIKKVQIENFKGIHSRLVIDFENIPPVGVNILSGANGFGKTTIFDTIEICMTGRFHRVSIFDHVQKKNSNRTKPFYQHTDGRDVVLKLWVENTATAQSAIIIKHYDDVHAPRSVGVGRDNIPADSSNFFDTYLTADTQYFDSNDFGALEKSAQQDIDMFFYGNESKIKIGATWYLFNYIQQEDSIYFLRQNEDVKGESLGFLFNIEKEEAQKEQLDRLVETLNEKSGSLNQQIAAINTSLSDFNTTPYERLFPQREFAFDSVIPFTNFNTAGERFAEFERNINSLMEFREKFNITEYDKSVTYNKILNDILNNRQLLHAMVIRKIFDAGLTQRLTEANNKINKAKSFIERRDKNVVEKEFFDLFTEGDNDSNAYQFLRESVQSIDKDLGEVGVMISELNTAREKCLLDVEKLRTANIITEPSCPLCDSPFKSFEELAAAIGAKTQRLSEFNASKLEEKRLLLDRIAIISGNVEVNARLFLQANEITEDSILNLFRNYPNFAVRIGEIITAYPILDSVQEPSLYLQSMPLNFSAISTMVTELAEFIEKTLLPQFSYNEQLIPNKGLYSEFFESNPGIFESVTVERLKNKLEHLRNAYNLSANERLQFLRERLAKLSRFRNEAANVLQKVTAVIKQHKSDMISKIKIPFYIYSGKILQSYQQGLGIFIDIHATGQSNNVRFRTGNTSDHDIVYHLSSGQMAVVSLAFCLCLNKVYNTNQNFKFLAIDDPIQTMDDLNIHTFIELVRNEFSDYQIILSTHDDFISRYMKYKFDKFDMNTQIQNIQQIVLEQTLQ